MPSYKAFRQTMADLSPVSILDRARHSLLRRMRRYLESSFDRRYGVDTAGVIKLRDLEIGAATVSEGIYYEPMPEKVFHSLMSQVQIQHSAFTFIDLGSGKGRALLMASCYPFHRIIGVEFAESLHRTAQQNFLRFRGRAQKCRNLESIQMDAALFEWPETPMFLFLYSPFKPPLLHRVMASLLDSLARAPRPVVVLFYGTNPKSLELIRTLHGFETRDLRVPTDRARKITRTGIVAMTSSVRDLK